MPLPHLFGTTLSGLSRQYPADLPETPVALVFGFAHEARHDVARWKRELEARGLPYLSLPSTVDDVPAPALLGIAEAMKAHVPPEAWDRIVQIHRGAGALLGTTSACTSVSSGRRPSSETPRQVPATGSACRETKSPDGSGTSRMPPAPISKQPTSSEGP